MASYRVFQNGKSAQSSIHPDDDIRFLRDGFSGFAFFLPLFFLIWHRLWIALAAYLVCAAASIVIAATMSSFLSFALNGLVGLFLGFEGKNIMAAQWFSRGWREIDVIVAATQEEAAIRFYAGSLPEAAALAGTHTGTHTGTVPGVPPTSPLSPLSGNLAKRERTVIGSLSSYPARLTGNRS